jgi:hypothetical protein
MSSKRNRIVVRNMFLNVVGTQANQSLTTGPDAYLQRAILTGDFTATLDNDFFLVQVGYTTAQLTQALNDQPIVAEWRGRVRQGATVTASQWSFNYTFELTPIGLFIPGGTLLSTYFATNSGTLTGRVFLVFLTTE